MSERDWLTERFEAHRPRLEAVAQRMLGSPVDAQDAVQETWLRLRGVGGEEIDNLGGWLTTVLGRVCLNMLRARRTRREEPEDAGEGAAAERHDDGPGPEDQALLADSVGAALLVVLETLEPAERLAVVLHDTFGVPFDEIAPIVGRSPAATRQLASRARRRVREAGPLPRPELDRQRTVVDAFLAAARDGDFEGLLAVLDPDVVLRADEAAITTAASKQVHGAPALTNEARGADVVAAAFHGKAQAAQPALVDGAAGAVWAPGGQVRAAYSFSLWDGRITAIQVIADPEAIGGLDVEILGS